MVDMILKYLKDGVWGYIDNIRQVATDDINVGELLRQYNERPNEGDTASCMNGEKLPADIAASNKVFTMAYEGCGKIFDKSEYGNCHTENLLDGEMVLKNYPASVILLYLNDHKEYDTVILVTNQKAFLMNDKGQTIERLV